MIQNGLVYAVNKSLEKERKREAKRQNNSSIIIELFSKYNVSYNERFSIKDWTKADIKKLHKAAEYPMHYITLNDNSKIKFDYNNNIIEPKQ